jgi:E3 ubiquitin-protein ligase TRIP12
MSRFMLLLENLRSEDEEQQLTTLQELAELLSMSTEESMAGFRSEPFVSRLLELSNYELNPNIMILACRCLSNLLEAWPPSANAIVFQNGIEALCSKLITIEYIDLAETAIEVGIATAAFCAHVHVANCQMWYHWLCSFPFSRLWSACHTIMG